MKRYLRKSVSFIVAASMLSSNVPMTAFADTVESGSAVDVSNDAAELDVFAENELKEPTGIKVAVDANGTLNDDNTVTAVSTTKICNIYVLSENTGTIYYTADGTDPVNIDLLTGNEKTEASKHTRAITYNKNNGGHLLYIFRNGSYEEDVTVKYAYADSEGNLSKIYSTKVHFPENVGTVVSDIEDGAYDVTISKSNGYINNNQTAVNFANKIALHNNCFIVKDGKAYAELGILNTNGDFDMNSGEYLSSEGKWEKAENLNSSYYIGSNEYKVVSVPIEKFNADTQLKINSMTGTSYQAFIKFVLPETITPNAAYNVLYLEDGDYTISLDETESEVLAKTENIPFLLKDNKVKMQLTFKGSSELVGQTAEIKTDSNFFKETKSVKVVQGAKAGELKAVFDVNSLAKPLIVTFNGNTETVHFNSESVKEAASVLLEKKYYTADLDVLKIDSDDTSSAARSLITNNVDVVNDNGDVKLKLYISTAADKLEQQLYSGGDYQEIALEASDIDGYNVAEVSINDFTDYTNLRVTVSQMPQPAEFRIGFSEGTLRPTYQNPGVYDLAYNINDEAQNLRIITNNKEEMQLEFDFRDKGKVVTSMTVNGTVPESAKRGRISNGTDVEEYTDVYKINLPITTKKLNIVQKLASGEAVKQTLDLKTAVFTDDYLDVELSNLLVGGQPLDEFGYAASRATSFSLDTSSADSAIKYWCSLNGEEPYPQNSAYYADSSSRNATTGKVNFNINLITDEDLTYTVKVVAYKDGKRSQTFTQKISFSEAETNTAESTLEDGEYYAGLKLGEVRQPEGISGSNFIYSLTQNTSRVPVHVKDGKITVDVPESDIVRFTGLNEYYSLESKEDKDGNKYTPVSFNSEKDVVTLGIPGSIYGTEAGQLISPYYARYNANMVSLNAITKVNPDGEMLGLADGYYTFDFAEDTSNVFESTKGLQMKIENDTALIIGKISVDENKIATANNSANSTLAGLQFAAEFTKVMPGDTKGEYYGVYKVHDLNISNTFVNNAGPNGSVNAAHTLAFDSIKPLASDSAIDFDFVDFSTVQSDWSADIVLDGASDDLASAIKTRAAVASTKMGRIMLNFNVDNTKVTGLRQKYFADGDWHELTLTPSADDETRSVAVADMFYKSYNGYFQADINGQTVDFRAYIKDGNLYIEDKSIDLPNGDYLIDCNVVRYDNGEASMAGGYFLQKDLKLSVTDGHGELTFYAIDPGYLRTFKYYDATGETHELTPTYKTIDVDGVETEAKEFTMPLDSITDPIALNAWVIPMGFDRDFKMVLLPATLRSLSGDLDIVSAPVVTVSPEAESYKNSDTVKVSIASETEGAKIYYTTDGEAPTTDSTEYKGEFEVKASGEAAETVTIKAIAVAEGKTNSFVTEKEIYFAKAASGNTETAELADGTYTVPVKMMNAYTTEESMGNKALDGDAVVTVKDGKASIDLTFKGITTAGLYGHLLKLWYYPGNDIAAYTASDRTEAAVKSTYTDKGLDGKTEGTFNRVYTIEKDAPQKEFHIKISVDAMDGFDQDARLVFDYDNAVKVKKQTLEDGVYSVPITALKAATDDKSMMNNALDGDAKVTVKDGKYTIEIATKGIAVGTQFGHLIKLWSYPASDTSSLDSLVEAKGTSTYTDKNLTGENATFTKTFAIERDEEDDIIYIRINVDAMEGFDQNARLSLDWANAKDYVEPSTETTTESTTESSTESTTDEQHGSDVTTLQAPAKAEKAADDTIRFVAGIDSLKYKEVGFIFEANGKEVRRSTKTVYSSIADSKLDTADFEGAEYLYSFEISDIADSGTQIRVTPYYVDLKGNEVKAESSVYSLNGLSGDDSLNTLTDDSASGSAINVNTSENEKEDDNDIKEVAKEEAILNDIEIATEEEVLD